MVINSATVYGKVISPKRISGNVYKATASGVNDYENLRHLPSLNGEEIIGDKTSEDYHITLDEMGEAITNVQMYALFWREYNK